MCTWIFHNVYIYTENMVSSDEAQHLGEFPHPSKQNSALGDRELALHPCSPLYYVIIYIDVVDPKSYYFISSCTLIETRHEPKLS